MKLETNTGENMWGGYLVELVETLIANSQDFSEHW